VPKQSVDLHGRLEALGHLIDAVQLGVPDVDRGALLAAVEKRVEAGRAWGEGSWSEASALADEGALLVAQAVAGRADDLSAMWKVERLIGLGQAHSDSINWTKPMLSMTEQLTLVLVLELAFGVIFELPLVMMVLGLVGLVTSKFLFKYQRHAFILCLLAAAVLTPTGDAVNLALMAGPMVLCYELGVLLVWLVERRRKVPQPQA
jgi:sec-independent protein translocase protein TatC